MSKGKYAAYFLVALMLGWAIGYLLREATQLDEKDKDEDGSDKS